MANYYAFAGEHYYPKGGGLDLLFVGSKEKCARKIRQKIKAGDADWGHIADARLQIVMVFSEYKGVVLSAENEDELDEKENALIWGNKKGVSLDTADNEAIDRFIEQEGYLEWKRLSPYSNTL